MRNAQVSDWAIAFDEHIAHAMQIEKDGAATDWRNVLCRPSQIRMIDARQCDVLAVFGQLGNSTVILIGCRAYAFVHIGNPIHLAFR